MLKTISALTAAAILTLAAPIGTALACEGHDKPAAAEGKKARPAKVATATFKIEGMHCAGCSDKITAKLNAQDGVVSVKVSVADKRATVEYDPSKLDTAKLAKIITDVGYKATAEA